MHPRHFDHLRGRTERRLRPRRACSVLQTKKRYVGYMYESPAQAAPTFDAKGIETVRRDSCPAVAKMLEASLRILFASRDLRWV